MMKRDDYDKQLIRWVKNHYWDSLEKDKDLILRHMRTFTGDAAIFEPKEGDEIPDNRAPDGEFQYG